MASDRPPDEGPSDREIKLLGTWNSWTAMAEKTPVAPAGREAARLAVEQCRQFLGEDWIADMLTRHRELPLIDLFPLASPAQVAGLVELGARIALADRAGLSDDLRSGLGLSRKPGDFRHLCLMLEVVGLSLRDGWSVGVEEPLGLRRPDLTLRRGTSEYLMEVTIQGRDKNLRETERYGWLVDQYRWSFESRFGIHLRVRSEEVLAPADVTDWFDEAAAAAHATKVDEQQRQVTRGRNVIEVAAVPFPSGSVHDGPPLGGDLGVRLGRRLQDKAAQTHGGSPAWIRLDIDPTFIALTGLAVQTPEQQLQSLTTGVTEWLQDAPHVAGVVLSTGARLATSHTAEASVLLPTGPPLPLLLSEPTTRQFRLAREPAALMRRLPGGRSRLSFVLPATGRLSTSATSPLHPGSWYDDEARWLRWACATLNWPAFA